MGLDMREFKHSRYYKSLNDLFTRELILKREIDKSSDSIISPTDSLITECGRLRDIVALQIKGMEYSVEELLTFYCTDNFEEIKDGDFMNFYLSPKDYHRYHAPCDFKLKKLIHPQVTLASLAEHLTWVDILLRWSPAALALLAELHLGVLSPSLPAYQKASNKHPHTWSNNCYTLSFLLLSLNPLNSN